MGNVLCGCHSSSSSPKYIYGKASSHDVLYQRSAPYRRELSLQTLSSTQRGGAFHLYSADPLLTSSPNRSPTANETEAYYNHDYNQNTVFVDSETTLDESGISSKGSSMLDDTPAGASTSAPSTPCMSIRRKAPPKPPRVRSIFEPLGPDSQSALPYHSCGTTPPNITVTSQRVDSLKSSLAYVTNTLDRSVAKNDPSGSLVMKRDPMAMKNKVFYVLMQLKDFLVQEINPSLIVDFLHQHGVINSWTEQELKRCKSANAMCEMLLDIISCKGKEEFSVLCKSLRIVERHDYLADLLYVVDRLIDIGTPTTSTQKYCSLSRGNSRISSGYESNYGVPNSESHCNGVLRECPECSSHNSGGEVLNECSTFDIEVSYLDVQTGEIVPNETIKQLKRRSTRALPNQRRKRLSSVDSYLLKTDKENADRYVPVLSISLYNQCLYDKGIDNLAQILERYCSIRELSMAKNHLDLIGMDRMGRALYRNRGLLKLDMRLNTISDEAASCICQGLRWNTSLRVLNISSTGLTGRGCTNLVEGLVKNLTLAELDVGFNDLQDEGCISIAKLLGTTCNLRKLRMRHNSITDKGLTILFRSLKKNARLSVLDIGSNKCGTESLMTLAEMLLCNRTLRELTLEKCNISIAGCVSLARALKTNTTLKFLDLSMNKIGDLGANSLSDGLKYNQVLDTLCLNMCKISNLGFMKLLISLRYNTAMCTLKLCYNDIGHATPAAEGHLVNTSLDTSFFSSSQYSPNTSQDTISFYHHTEPTATEDIPNVEEVYEKLAQILQYNKNLKVLLWGNKLQEPNTQ